MARGKATAVEAEAEDHIDENAKAMERLIGIAENAEFESGSLVGDIRDTLLDVTKNRPKPWSAMSEQEQRDLAKALENVAKTFIRKTVLIVAEQDDVSVTATLKGYGVKGDVFALKAEARGDEDTALELFRMDGHDVVIISADASRFTGQRKDAEVQVDQPALGFSDPPSGDDEEETPPDDNSDLVEAAEEPVAEDEEEIVPPGQLVETEEDIQAGI